MRKEETIYLDVNILTDFMVDGNGAEGAVGWGCVLAENNGFDSELMSIIPQTLEVYIYKKIDDGTEIIGFGIDSMSHSSFSLAADVNLQKGEKLIILYQYYMIDR